jgi:protocatechuate 3,4-dioxygenase beta subunit
MIRAIDEYTITGAVIDQMAGTKNERLKEIMEAAVRLLHAFAREVNLTPDEWIQGIRFLTATGHACTEYRQEFILLSDTLGLSSLVNSLHDRRSIQEATKSSLLGPFYRQDSPTFELGQSIADNCAGETIGVYGRVTDANGRPIAHASIEVWQPDENGFYDLQKQDPSEMELRGRFFSDEAGLYHFRTIKPRGYKIPMDGPVATWSARRDGMAGARLIFTFSSARRDTAKASPLSTWPTTSTSTPIQYSEPMNRSLRNPNRTAQDHPSDRFRAFISISRSPQRKIRRRLRSRDVSAPIHPSS